MHLKYIVKSRVPFHEIDGLIRACIIEVEDERDKGDEDCCVQQSVSQAPSGEVHLWLYEVGPNWEPGKIYWRMLIKKLREEGCRLELLELTP